MTSSPLHPQSNGKAEKGVHIVKQLLKKAQDSRCDPYLALLSYQTTPLEHVKSPAGLLVGHRLRTTLPYMTKKTDKELEHKLKETSSTQTKNEL